MAVVVVLWVWVWGGARCSSCELVWLDLFFVFLFEKREKKTTRWWYEFKGPPGGSRFSFLTIRTRSMKNPQAKKKVKRNGNSGTLELVPSPGEFFLTLFE